MSLLKRARPGYVWTWTEKMQELYPDRKAGERCDYDGRYIYSVPVLWMAKGYVIEKEDERMNVSAEHGHIWVWTEKSDQTPGQAAGHTVPQVWIDKGYVRQEIDRAQVDIFDLMGG